jgi:hypothetical protein
MENQQSPKKETNPTAPASVNAGKMVLGRENYILIGIGLVVILIGFILMSGGKSDDPNVFKPEEVYSATRITVAPIVVILGFIIEIYAVFHRSKK